MKLFSPCSYEPLSIVSRPTNDGRRWWKTLDYTTSHNGITILSGKGWSYWPNMAPSIPIKSWRFGLRLRWTAAAASEAASVITSYYSSGTIKKCIFSYYDYIQWSLSLPEETVVVTFNGQSSLFSWNGGWRYYRASGIVDTSTYWTSNWSNNHGKWRPSTLPLVFPIGRVVVGWPD